MKLINLNEIAKQHMPLYWEAVSPAMRIKFLLAMQQACEETVTECAHNVFNCCHTSPTELTEAVNYTSIQIIVGAGT
ncbi:MAG: hypothetical protein ACOYMF_14335 [Bacteroidales bacterium]